MVIFHTYSILMLDYQRVHQTFFHSPSLNGHRTHPSGRGIVLGQLLEGVALRCHHEAAGHDANADLELWLGTLKRWRISHLFTCMYTYIYIYLFIYRYYLYIYIYMYKERERERENGRDILSAVYMRVYIYIHICMYTCRTRS